ncbi:hypothetical protein T484DRAFT_2610554 [Baffinella frigidus]|nr:hypothetical protein T484DRAFT_2610554 [Cryptophyta sp. CCMP2293]
MVSANQQLDEDELRDKAELGEVVLDDFKDKLEEYNGQVENVGKILDVRDCGIMQVDSRRLKNLIAPSPQACLEKIQVLLPQLAATKQRKVLDEVNAANNRLNAKPETVSQFVAILEFIAECNERKEEIDEAFVGLQQHYAVMDAHDVQVASIDRAAYQMLVPEYSQMKNMLDLLDSTKDEDMAKWAGKLEEDIKGFHLEVESLKKLAEDPHLLEDQEFLDPMLQVTQELKEQATDLELRMKKNTEFQGIFGQQLERYPTLELAVSDINLKRGMWEVIPNP